MGDPLAHVLPGDPLSIPASAWNDVLDLVREKNGPGGPGAPRPNLERPALVVRVKAGSSLPNRAIITLGAALTDPDTEPLEAARVPLFDAEAPVAGAVPAVLLSGLTSGEVGRAVVRGVCVASVVISDAGHQYAVPVVGDVNSLESADSGAFRLLTNPGVGTAKCLVLLDQDIAASTGVTVEEADGAPSYTNATTIEVDQDTGLKLITGGGGAPQIRIAQKVNPPVDRVLIGNTVFGPPVIFSADDAADNPTDGQFALLTGQSTPSENGYYVYVSAGGGTLLARTEANDPPIWTGAGATVSCTGGTKVNTTWVHLGSGVWVCAVGNNYDSILGRVAYVPIYGTIAGEENLLLPSPINFDDSTLGGTNELFLYSADMTLGQASVNSKLRLYGNYVVCEFPSTGSGAWLDGVSGALGPGAEATGGIITDLGTGAFVGTATSNAFTNTNSFADTTTFTGSVLSQSDATFTPADAATVPVTVQGAASQTADLLQLKNSAGTLLGGFDKGGVGEFSMDFGTY